MIHEDVCLFVDSCMSQHRRGEIRRGRKRGAGGGRGRVEELSGLLDGHVACDRGGTTVIMFRMKRKRRGKSLEGGMESRAGEQRW